MTSHGFVRQSKEALMHDNAAQDRLQLMGTHQTAECDIK